ncbi:c-type cytochrome biogenesis protein CcsB [Enemella sp. A6]|uniref:c-type cytochrome biogenesis protein CcsB n=1 Tax=Enemella sp. A6 TaxID=3440152 RepID=UPI003EBB948B
MDLSTLSTQAMTTAWVVYLIAMVAHALEWSVARNLSTKVERKRRRVLVGAGAAAGADLPTATEETRVETTEDPRLARFGKVGLLLTTVAFVFHLVGVVTRGLAGDRFPWANMYEFITSTLLFVVAAYLVGAVRFGMRWAGLFVTLLSTIGIGLAVTVFYVDVAPLVPALHSVWFVIHIVTAAVSAAAFNLGAVATILYLVRDRAERKGTVRGYLAKLPSAERLDVIAYRFHAFSFPLWTFTIAAGAVWAQFAWGRFWGWDPKETWSLITWVAYAAYLHARATAGWRGRKAAVIALIGVATFWFNYIGVNMLIPGLHSYAGI